MEPYLKRIRQYSIKRIKIIKIISIKGVLTMNKKFMAAVLIGCMCVQGVSVMAEELLIVTKDTQIENTMEETVAPKEENSKVTTIIGEVTNVSEGEYGYEVLVGKEMEGTRFLVQPDTLVMEVDTLKMISVKDIKVGMNVTVVLDKNTPMTMSIPPLTLIRSKPSPNTPITAL